MRKLISSILLLGLLSSAANETFAQCSCVATNRDITPHKEFKLAEAVFIGKVIEIKKTARDKNTNSYVETVTFQVIQAWKRDLEINVIIRNKVQGCLSGFEENEEWLVYAYKKQDGTLGTYCCCSRTRLLSKASEDLKEFEAKGEQPTKIMKPAKWRRSLTSHWTGRALSRLLIENLDGSGGLCAPVNSSVRRHGGERCNYPLLAMLW